MANTITKVSEIRSGDMLVFERANFIAFNWGYRIVYSRMDKDLIDATNGNGHGFFEPHEELLSVGVNKQLRSGRLMSVHRPDCGYSVGVDAKCLDSRVRVIWRRDVLEVKLNGEVVDLSSKAEAMLLAQLEKSNG